MPFRIKRHRLDGPERRAPFNAAATNGRTTTTNEKGNAMIETTIANWGNVNPVQFVRAVTPQMANDLAEMGRRLRLMEDAIHERAGGGGGRSLTDGEANAYAKLTAATNATTNALLAVNAVLSESVTLPAMHDGGPDTADGAPSDGHVSDGVLV